MKNIVILFLTLIIIASCSEVDPKKQIIEIEKQLTEAYKKGNIKEVKEIGEKAIKLYEKLADISQDPEEKATYTFKAAGYYISIFQNFDKAIYLIDKIIEKYPNTRIAERAFFLKAYIFANELKKINEAEKLYKEFIQKFPNSSMVEQAKQELRHLGKSPEEILNSYNDSTQKAIQ